MRRGLALLALLAATGAPTEESFAEVWARATLWQVGENVEVVADARAEIVAMGEAAVPLVMARLGATSTLVRRALWAVVPAIGEPFREPLLAEVATGDGARLENAIDLLRRLGAAEVVDAVAARWPEGALPAGPAGRQAMAAVAAFARTDMAGRVALSLSECGRDAVAAAQALGGLTVEESGRALAAVVDGDCPQTRWAAQRALAGLGETAWLPEGGRGRVRTLALMEGAAARRLLRRHLDDEDWAARLDAAMALDPESASDRRAARARLRVEGHAWVVAALEEALAP